LPRFKCGVALTEKLQLVAYKDGFSKFTGGELNGYDGWNDIALGIKYALVQDWANEYHLAFGVGYEFDWGNSEVLQNTDELRLWISENKSFASSTSARPSTISSQWIKIRVNSAFRHG
jgi:hypothetical protein